MQPSDRATFIAYPQTFCNNKATKVILMSHAIPHGALARVRVFSISLRNAD